MKRVLILCILLLQASQSLGTIWTYTETETGANNLAIGYPVPRPVDSLIPVDGFRSYASLHARHQDLMLLSNMIEGRVIGQSEEGRDIWAYVLSDPDALMDNGEQLESAALQNGGIHAREWASPEVTTAIIERFAEKAADQHVHQYLLNNMQLIIVPILNVDGFIQTQRFPDTTRQSTFASDPSTWPRDGRMRRKNMVNVDHSLDTTTDTLNGVDLNRNHAPYWASSSRSSNLVGSLVYHGDSAGSERESQALYQAAGLVQPEQLRFYVDTHSYSQLWYQPNTHNTRRNSIASRIGGLMQGVTRNRYGLEPSGPNGGIGSTDEYFADTYGIPAYTLEIEPGSGASTQYGGYGVSHAGFILPESEINRVRNELTDASIIAWYALASPPAIKAVEIRRISDGNVVFAGQWQQTSVSARQWQETTNLGLESGQTYRLWVAYDKPMRWLNAANEIQNFANRAATAPSIQIEGLDASNQGFKQVLNTSIGDWLISPGGPGVGYLNYKTDAFMVDFELDANIDPQSASLLSLALVNHDMAGQINDANPATTIDFDEHWLGYEGTDGTGADIGGVDRTLRIVDDGSDPFVDPNASTDNTEPPVAQPEPNNRTSGGGLLSFWFMGLLLLYTFSRRVKTHF